MLEKSNTSVLIGSIHGESKKNLFLIVDGVYGIV